MAELLATVHRHRQAIFALLMIVLVIGLLWTARGALPAFFIGVALAFVLDHMPDKLHIALATLGVEFIGSMVKGVGGPFPVNGRVPGR